MGKEIQCTRLHNSLSRRMVTKKDGQKTIFFLWIIENEELKIDESGIQFENNEIHTQIKVLNESNDENKINFENGKVNMSASYLTQLKMMSGSLNAYYNQTISDTGRKKVI